MDYSARPMRSTRRLQNLTGQRPRWYQITNAAPGQPTQVSIYDEIGFFGVAAGEFMAELTGINGDIELHINSPGGDVHDGLAIYNQLKQRKGTVHVIVDGLAASAASFIAMAASPGKLEMAPHSQMMIHNGFSMAIGDAADLRKTADLLDMVTGEIAAIYSERSGKSADYWLGKMSAETWFTDKQAVSEGLADGIHGESAPENAWDLSVYAKAPGAVSNALNDGTHEPMTGTHTHPVGDAAEYEHSHDDDADHDPDGDGDDDTTPEGDTDHDYVEPDGSPGPKAGNHSSTDFSGLAELFKAQLTNADSLTDEAEETLQSEVKKVDSDDEPEDLIDELALSALLTAGL